MPLLQNPPCGLFAGQAGGRMDKKGGKAVLQLMSLRNHATNQPLKLRYRKDGCHKESARLGEVAVARNEVIGLRGDRAGEEHRIDHHPHVRPARYAVISAAISSSLTARA